MLNTNATARTTIVLLSLAATGCNYETKDPNSNECTNIPGVEEDCEISTSEDTGPSETGDGDEPAEYPSGQCRHNLDLNNPDDYGWRFQCEGELYASIDFDAPLGNDCEQLLGDRCHEHHVFGPSNDSYAAPDVMACCGVYDPAAQDNYFRFCDYDIIQQVCISMAKRLEKMVEDGTFGLYVGQGAKLQQWVATNYKACFTTLQDNDAAPESGKIISSWAIPNSPDWPDLDNFVISIDDGTSVTGVMQPPDPADWLSCQSALDNNDEIFEDATPPNGGVIHHINLDAELAAAMSGPELFGGEVTAALHFDPNCATKGCSSAELWQDGIDGTKLVVLDLTLFTDRFSVDNGSMSMVVDSARFSLYEHAAAMPTYDPRGDIESFVIPPGNAFFLFSGAAGNDHDHYLARNASAITISHTPDGWQLEPFELGYVDENGQTWSVSLGASQWR